MVLRFEVTGIDNVQKYLISLGPKEEKYLSNSNFEFMKKVNRSAKARAPRDTGHLANSIMITKTIVKGSTHQFKIISNAEHSIFQEEGFKPHFAPILNSSKLIPGVYFVSKFTPFIKPALEFNLSNLPQQINMAMKEALKK